jgi:hypothetical protein
MIGQLVHVLLHPTNLRGVIVDDKGNMLLAVVH